MAPRMTETTPQFWVQENGGTLVRNPKCHHEGTPCSRSKRIPRRLSTAKARCAALAEARAEVMAQAYGYDPYAGEDATRALVCAASAIDGMEGAAICALQKIDVGER